MSHPAGVGATRSWGPSPRGVDRERAPPLGPGPVPGSRRAGHFVTGVLSGRSQTPACSGRRHESEAIATVNDREMGRLLSTPLLPREAAPGSQDGCRIVDGAARTGLVGGSTPPAGSQRGSRAPLGDGGASSGSMPPPPLPSGAYWALGAYWLSGLWKRPLPSPAIETGDQQHQEHGNSMEDDPLQGGTPQGDSVPRRERAGEGGHHPIHGAPSRGSSGEAAPSEAVVASVERRPDATMAFAEFLISAKTRARTRAAASAGVRSITRRRGARSASRWTATRRLTFTVDDGAVAIVGTTLGAGDALAGVIFRGASVTAVPTGLHAVTDGIGTRAAHDIGPPTRAVVNTREGVSAFAARGFSCVARSWLANVAATAEDTYYDSSVARPVVDSSYQIGATDAADFARNRRYPCRAGQTARLGATAVVSHGHNSAAAPFARNPTVNSRRRATQSFPRRMGKTNLVFRHERVRGPNLPPA